MGKPIFGADLPDCCKRQLRDEEGIPDRLECPSCGALWRHAGFMHWTPIKEDHAEGS